MLPCIVIDFFLDNQQDALIIQIYSVIKLYMFGHLHCPSSRVFYCTFGTGKFHAGFLRPFPSRVRMELRSYPDSAWNRLNITLFFKIVAGIVKTFTKSWNQLMYPRVIEVCRQHFEPRHDFFLHLIIVVELFLSALLI